MFRIVICDNNDYERVQTQNAVEDFLKRNKEIKAKVELFSSSEELRKILLENADLLKTGDIYSVYILDIMMPGIDGIELGHCIREFDRNTPIVYTTSYKEYAFDAFGVRALDYVLKPINRTKLNEILSRCYRIWKRIQKDEVMVKGKNGMTTVTVRNIMYVENNARCAVYHMRDKSVVTSVCNRGKFEDAIAPLPDRPQFIRPHKSYLVNMDYIDEFGVEEIKLDDETLIPVSRNQRNDVKHRYLQYYTEESESVDLR